MALLDEDDRSDLIIEKRHEIERWLVAAILRLGRRLPCGLFRDAGASLPCRGIVDGGRMSIPLDATDRYSYRETVHQLVVDLAGVVAAEGGAS